jgi:hypothetical protein
MSLRILRALVASANRPRLLTPSRRVANVARRRSTAVATAPTKIHPPSLAARALKNANPITRATAVSVRRFIEALDVTIGPTLAADRPRIPIRRVHRLALAAHPVRVPARARLAPLPALARRALPRQARGPARARLAPLPQALGAK